MSTVATSDNDQSQSSPKSLEQARLLQPAPADAFVEGRVGFLAEYLEFQLPLHGLTVVDFECGVGNESSELREQLHAKQVIGFDADQEALDVAEHRHFGSRFHTWTADATAIESASIDVVYAVGVLQSRGAEERHEVLQAIYSWLKPGGYVALFENNPCCAWGGCILLEAQWKRKGKRVQQRDARKCVAAAGFECQMVRSLFFFPKLLACLRSLDAWLAPIPAGAQYCVLSKRPE